MCIRDRYITPGMAHANSLFAVALFIWVWHSTRTARTKAGWCARWTAAGGVRFIVSAAARVGAEFRRRAGRYAVFVASIGVAVAPQFYVYRTLNGVFGPTPFVVEKFSLVPVHAYEVLFSGFHGLFSWHPVTLIAVIGLTFMWRGAPGVVLAFLTVFTAQVLVIGSYETWWGGASFGARRFLNCTAVFALGLAAAVGSLAGAARRAGAVAIVLLILWNFGLTVQYSVGLNPHDAPVRMAEIAYNQVFEVPPRIARIAWQFAFDRSSFFRTRP